LFLFWTILTVPYESLGPELSNDYHERTTIFGLRDGLLILGTCVAAVSPALSSGCLTALGFTATERLTFMVIALIYGPLVLMASFICVWRVREKSRFNPKKTERFFSGYTAVIKNRPFVILLGAYTLSSFGSNLPATLILYYVQYVLQADHAEAFLAVYFLVGIACLPLWIVLSRKTGKKAAWILSMLINTGAFSGVFFLGPGDVMAYGILVAVSGVGFGAGLALPSSIQADVIDYDELITGRRREGRYIGLWSISKKLAAALGVGLGLWFLGKVGYVPNTAQNNDVVDMLRILYALIPCACNALSIGIIFFYPMNEQMHHDIQKKISEAEPRPMGSRTDP
jgi:GPH family glycoside/pentoside/hexuronide:cation symporter